MAETTKATEPAKVAAEPDKVETKGHWTRYHTVGFVFVIVGLVLDIYFGKTGRLGAVWIWVFSAGLILLSIIIAGHGVIGRWPGLLIDDRNKFSLSRLQLILWTTLILSAFLASVSINLNSAFNPPINTTMIMGAATIAKPPINTTMILGAATIAIPQEIWILMGIATTSLVGSPLILSMNKGKNGSQTDADITSVANKDIIRTHTNLEAQGRASSNINNFVRDQVDGQLIVNRDPKFANWSDMFKGEYTNNAAQLDLGKVQMMYFTLILLVAYTVALVSVIASSTEIHQFPPLSEGMLALLGISNGGYLLAKTVSPNPIKSK